MKNAYVSVVLPVAFVPTGKVIEKIDSVLAQQARAHEIVLITPYGAASELRDPPSLQGPVSIVSTHHRTTTDSALMAGLARTVGDFIIEWRGPLNAIDNDLIGTMLAPTDLGVELVEMTGVPTSIVSRIFNKVVNSLRPRSAPILKTVGRTYSRRALQVVLGAAAFDPQLDLLIAELPVQRFVQAVPHPNPRGTTLSQRINSGFSLLSNGSRFGSAIPLALAAISAILGVVAAIYALGFLLVRGQTPEGWTTLVVLIGLGQAAILTMLGITWMRIDSLTRGLAKDPDVTVHVEVLTPG